MKLKPVDDPRASWRKNLAYFKDALKCSSGLYPGAIDFSPAWHMSSHKSEVSVHCVVHVDMLINMFQWKFGTTNITTSPILQGGPVSPGRQWLQAFSNSHALVTGILRIMHPELYHTSCEVMAELQKLPEQKDIVGCWGCPYNALSIIVNRSCPPHIDTKSRAPYFNIISSFGHFDTAFVRLPSIGGIVHLKPGGFVGLCGHVVYHEVLPCDDDRICYAWYMRRSVHADMEARPATWMSQDVYAQFVHDPVSFFWRSFDPIFL